MGVNQNVQRGHTVDELAAFIRDYMLHRHPALLPLLDVHELAWRSLEHLNAEVRTNE